MVVLSVAICTKSGKALISRQFVEMNRIRIEGLLAAFPKLLGSDSKQHTFVETESVRYVYQPMDNLYLLLITNRASNIVEDLETLRLLSKVVPDVAGTANNLSEEKISDKCFELMFAFDEVITAGGYREPITLQQIRTNMEMESHEENLHNMIKISKMETAKDQARDAARTIRERQREQQRLGVPSGMGSAGSNDSAAASFGDTSNTAPEIKNLTPVPVASAGSGRAPPIKGMSLMGLNSKNKSLEDAMAKEDKLAPLALKVTDSSPIGLSSSSNDSQGNAPQQIQQPIMLAIVEKVSAKINKSGLIENFEVKGSLTLTTTADAPLAAVQLVIKENEESFVFNTHPKINKALYESNGVLQLKDLNKTFPPQRPVGILKWNYSSTSENSNIKIPIKINCWPEEEGRGICNVSIEYTTDTPVSLHDVRVRIPLGCTETPNIVSSDYTYKHSPSTGELVWEIPFIDQSNPTGGLEFSILQRDLNVFFPIVVTFHSQKLFCEVDVTSVRATDGNFPIQFGLSKSMSSEEYLIG